MILKENVRKNMKKKVQIYSSLCCDAELFTGLKFDWQRFSQSTFKREVSGYLQWIVNIYN